MDRRTFIGGVAGGLLVVPLVARAQAARADDVPRAALFAYVANNGAGTVSAFRMDAATGALTPLAPTAIASDKNPYSVTIDAGSTLHMATRAAS